MTLFFVATSLKTIVDIPLSWCKDQKQRETSPDSIQRKCTFYRNLDSECYKASHLTFSKKCIFIESGFFFWNILVRVQYFNKIFALFPVRVLISNMDLAET